MLLKEFILLRILGGLLFIGGVSAFLIGLTSILQKWGHNLSPGIFIGIYFIIAGFGLIKLQPWAIVMSIVPFVISTVLYLVVLIKDKPSSPIVIISFAFVSLGLILFLILQWKKIK